MSERQASPSAVELKNFDLVAVGDLIIDFTCLGRGDAGMLVFERNPGGSPMNVAAQVTRLGGTAAVFACVGLDEHGEFLRETLRGLGVNVDNVYSDPKTGTRLIFVYFKDGNDRCFSDYRGSRADLEISPDAVDCSQAERAKVFLFSPLCNKYDKPIFETTRRALDAARRGGALIAFDPNYRFPYDDEQLRRLDMEAIRSAHILKMTSAEFEYYLGEKNVMRGTEALLAGNARVVAISMGRGGCLLRSRQSYVRRPAHQVEAVDTTGAGDSFMGALIHQLTRPGVDVESLPEEKLAGMAEFANACAAASTTRRGSLLAMPDKEEALRVMTSVPRVEAVCNLLDPAGSRP